MKTKLLALSLALILALSLAACGGKDGSSASAGGQDAADTQTSDGAQTPAETPVETVKITVAASPTPHAEILNQCVPILAEQGIELVVNEYSDYVMPNLAVEDGDEDANYFQHVPYLDDFNAERGTHLVNAAGVHVEPMGLYAGKSASLDAIPDGGKVAVPNDSTNEGRALLLLEAQGLITLKDSTKLDSTKNDIAENPKNLEFVELEAANIPANLDEVDIAAINSNYALGAGLNPVEDALVIEAADSPYVNILTVKEGNENNEAILALVEALHSDAIRDYINETFGGAVVPAF
ncbi:MAG: ABC transporter substrate-binding protein [Oscillibacter sp.]|nr:ABC transporter substrate-binding protein [Oscillibacter sp.]